MGTDPGTERFVPQKKVTDGSEIICMGLNNFYYICFEFQV